MVGVTLLSEEQLVANTPDKIGNLLKHKRGEKQSVNRRNCSVANHLL